MYCVTKYRSTPTPHNSSEAKASRVMMLKFPIKLPVNRQAAKSLDVYGGLEFVRLRMCKFLLSACMVSS